jgi:gluconolactonase
MRPPRTAYLAVLSVLGVGASAAPVHESRLLAPGASWEKVVGDLKFGEGPAWHPDGYLLFEDVPKSRTLKLSAADAVSVFREQTENANGLAFDGERRLVVCQGNDPVRGRRLVRIERDGAVTVLADRYQGKRLNSPNDVTVDRRGHIYFTDPRYSKRENLELDKEGVYRVSPDGSLTRIIDGLARPNGIVVTRDGRTLYVADNASPGGVVQLWAYDLDARGEARAGRVIYDFVEGRGIDGMTLDEAGRIWATAGTKEKAGIYVFEPDGKRGKATLAAFIAMNEDPTNCTFGGPRRDVLYVTTISSVYRIRTAVRGQESPPGK